MITSGECGLSAKSATVARLASLAVRCCYAAVADDVHRRAIPEGEAGVRFVHYYRRLSDLGLAPRILEVTDSEIVTELHPTLRQWLDGGPSVEERDAMARKLIARIEEIHRHGICHRDLHVENVVLRDEVPLVVDTAFATASDPIKPCYDLVGPGPSGVPVPPEHAGQPNENQLGVWWDSTGPVPTLGQEFWRLSEVRRRTDSAGG